MPQEETKGGEGLLKNKLASGKAISRRNFLRFSLHASALVVFGGVVKLIDRAGGEKLHLRPPGAVNPEHFNSLCLRCGICEAVCPQQVIQPAALTGSLEAAGSPKLCFDENYCNLCMQCTLVCPTGALQPIHQSEARIGIAQVLPDRCIVWKSGNPCGVCVAPCPFQAIRKDSRGRPVVIPELCVGCGICEQACRLSAGASFTKGIVVVPVGSGETNDL